MTLLVRDEEDILEANLRFHLDRGVDLILVTDNGSVDATPEILRRYERTGRVHVHRELEDTYAQSRWVTTMARMAYEQHDASWVINADADEFWWPKSGDLKTSLAGVPDAVGIVEARRVNFLPVAGGSELFYERMLVREVSSLNSLGRPLPPKVCHRGAAEVVVEQGNHALRSSSWPTLPAPGPLVILHFPVRRFAQLKGKIVKGGGAYERNREVGAEVGATWRSLYALLRRGELRSFYEAELLASKDVAPAVAAGRLVVDRRLREHFRSRRRPADETRVAQRPGDATVAHDNSLDD
jgi:hypothetical protein